MAEVLQRGLSPPKVSQRKLWFAPAYFRFRCRDTYSEVVWEPITLSDAIAPGADDAYVKETERLDNFRNHTVWNDPGPRSPS